MIIRKNIKKIKKITILSILLIFFNNLLFADSHDIDPTRFHLEKKNDDQFGLYNIYVEDWNNHVTDLYSDFSSAVNIFNIKKFQRMECDIFADKVWRMNDKFYMKWKCKIIHIF